MGDSWLCVDVYLGHGEDKATFFVRRGFQRGWKTFFKCASDIGSSTIKIVDRLHAADNLRRGSAAR